MMNREKIHAWWVTSHPELNDLAPLQVILGDNDLTGDTREPMTTAQAVMLAQSWRGRYARILDLLVRNGWETVPCEIGSPPLTLDAGDIQFLGARLRRLFNHFGYPLPDFAKDDRLLIGIAPTCIGAVLANPQRVRDSFNDIADVMGDAIRGLQSGHAMSVHIIGNVATVNVFAPDEAFRKTVVAARKVWLEENGTDDGTDQVTPFDQFLYGAAAKGGV